MLVRKVPEVKLYWCIRQDLSVQQGFILYQTNKITKKELLDRLHEGHQGIVKCKSIGEIHYARWDY